MNDDREMNEGQEIARSRAIQEILGDTEFPPEPSVELQLAYVLQRVLNWSTPYGSVEHCLPPWLREYAEDAINRFVALWESEEVFRTALRHLPEPGPEVRTVEPEAPRVTTGRTVGTLVQPAWPDEETVRRIAREVCLQVLTELGLARSSSSRRGPGLGGKGTP